jgi:hypothetical protein
MAPIRRGPAATRAATRAAAAGLGAILGLVIARPADAMGLCDSNGHFCVTLDATSARVCDTSRPGRLDPASCEPGDELLRTMARSVEKTSAGVLRPVASLVVRFEELRVNVSITRDDALPDLANDASLAAYAGGFEQGANAAVRSSGWLIEPVGAPSMLRIRDVQIARLQWHGVSANVTGAVHFVEIVYAVQAEGAGYLVAFVTAGSEVSRVAPFAEATMATLDAIPRSAARGGEAATWIARGLMAAGVLAVAAIVLQRLSRRGRASIEPRDLWPMD